MRSGEVLSPLVPGHHQIAYWDCYTTALINQGLFKLLWDLETFATVQRKPAQHNAESHDCPRSMGVGKVWCPWALLLGKLGTGAGLEWPPAARCDFPWTQICRPLTQDIFLPLHTWKSERKINIRASVLCLYTAPITWARFISTDSSSDPILT